jgi:hypothetical protein
MLDHAADPLAVEKYAPPVVEGAQKFVSGP